MAKLQTALGAEYRNKSEVEWGMWLSQVEAIADVILDEMDGSKSQSFIDIMGDMIDNRGR